MSDAYFDFLREKIKLARFTGFDVDHDEINPALRPHTRDIVRWMAKGGSRAVFASFGLHKTATQLEWLRLVGKHRPGLRLQVLPLGAGGSELNAAYFRDQVHYLQAAEREFATPSLFDPLDEDSDALEVAA